MLMLVMLDFGKCLPNLKKHGRDFASVGELSDEIEAERNNMILFATDEVINSLKRFLQNPTNQTFNETALQMRKDLYNLKTKLNTADLIIN